MVIVAVGLGSFTTDVKSDIPTSGFVLSLLLILLGHMTCLLLRYGRMEIIKPSRLSLLRLILQPRCNISFISDS